MSLRMYLVLMSIGTVFCWVAWFFLTLNVAPAEAGLLGFIFFYSSLFLAILGTFSVLGFYVRRAVIKNDDVVFRHVRQTFQQSVLFSAGSLIALFLLARRLLTWWNALLLLAGVGLLAALIVTHRKFRNGTYVK